jgi:hypothetical protein
MLNEGTVVSAAVLVTVPSQLPGILIILEIDGMLELFKI